MQQALRAGSSQAPGPLPSSGPGAGTGLAAQPPRAPSWKAEVSSSTSSFISLVSELTGVTGSQNHTGFECMSQ